VDHLHDIHNYAWQLLKLASNWIKTSYNRLANGMGYHDDDKTWLYRPTHTKEKLPKLQSSWEGPDK
jgi:hypothetical protein